MKFGRCPTRTGNALITHPDFQDPRGTNYFYNLPFWSELRDSNARSSDPKSGVLNQALLSSEFQDTHSFHPIENKKFAASVFLVVAAPEYCHPGQEGYEPPAGALQSKPHLEITA